ncbi:hypothetical protein PR202_ga04527 [Eleusine coracana subsp. coracana]|uniref:Protein N-terminal glutamine amidohydrolase n=1 Tax=Eleusine coracana subsp. coracana TaxID=191504 RepID=A0AAV5BS82_ELECO|nr:hypothetical protein PR202_ga04527 [Eleusine coracana subsp. coracana]
MLLGHKRIIRAQLGHQLRQAFHSGLSLPTAVADLRPLHPSPISMDDDRAAAGGDPSPRDPPLHPAAPSNPAVDASSFTHTPCYCTCHHVRSLNMLGFVPPCSEENVYLLCKELIRTGVADPGGNDLYVVFISNERKQVPLWHQKASNSDDGFICWDYHVICIQYVSNAIRPLSFGDSVYRRLFRVIHAPLFLRSFASDRSHMKDAMGNWIQLPPKYEPIVAEDGTTNNLNEYIAVSTDDVLDLESMVNDVCFNKHGVVVNEMVLPKFFARLPGQHP